MSREQLKLFAQRAEAGMKAHLLYKLVAKKSIVRNQEATIVFWRQSFKEQEKKVMMDDLAKRSSPAAEMLIKH